MLILVAYEEEIKSGVLSVLLNKEDLVILNKKRALPVSDDSIPELILVDCAQQQSDMFLNQIYLKFKNQLKLPEIIIKPQISNQSNSNLIPDRYRYDISIIYQYQIINSSDILEYMTVDNEHFIILNDRFIHISFYEEFLENVIMITDNDKLTIIDQLTEEIIYSDNSPVSQNMNLIKRLINNENLSVEEPVSIKIGKEDITGWYLGSIYLLYDNYILLLCFEDIDICTIFRINLTNLNCWQDIDYISSLSEYILGNKHPDSCLFNKDQKESEIIKSLNINKNIPNMRIDGWIINYYQDKIEYQSWDDDFVLRNNGKHLTIDDSIKNTLMKSADILSHTTREHQISQVMNRINKYINKYKYKFSLPNPLKASYIEKNKVVLYYPDCYILINFVNKNSILLTEYTDLDKPYKIERLFCPSGGLTRHCKFYYKRVLWRFKDNSELELKKLGQNEIFDILNFLYPGKYSLGYPISYDVNLSKIKLFKQYLIPEHWKNNYFIQFLSFDNQIAIFGWLVDQYMPYYGLIITDGNYEEYILKYGNITSSAKKEIDSPNLNEVKYQRINSQNDLEININSKNELKLKTASKKLNRKKTYGYKAVKTADGDLAIAKLFIPENAQVAYSPSAHELVKMRSNIAIPISIYRFHHNKDIIKYLDEVNCGYSCVYTDAMLKYSVGELITVADFDPSLEHVCVPGIHFTATQEEAFQFHGLENVTKEKIFGYDKLQNKDITNVENINDEKKEKTD